MKVRFSALCASRPPIFLVLIFIIDGVDPRLIVRLEGLNQLKNFVTSSGIEPASSQLVT
jgi:hypothetical protein